MRTLLTDKECRFKFTSNFSDALTAVVTGFQQWPEGGVVALTSFARDASATGFQ